MATNIDMLKQMVCAIITTHVTEITCEECFKHIERFAELTLSGGDARTARAEMPLIDDHLQHCADCREEFEALLVALRAAASPSAPHLSANT